MPSLKHISLSLGACAMVALAGNAAHADIRIALAIPATGGQIAALGAQARLGAETAVKALNAKGGINGEKVTLEVVDDQCDPKTAVAAANQIVAKDIKFVLGHLCSGASIAASSVYEEEGILMLTGSATAPDLTDRNLKMVFRACGRDDQQGLVGAQYIADKLRAKRVAVLHDKQVYGKGLADKAEAVLKAAGIQPVYVGSITAGERDYSAIVGRLKQENVDAVYYGGYHTELGLIARQARQNGLTAPFVGGDGLASAEYWQIAGDGGAQTYFTFSPDPKGRPEAKAVYEELKKGGEPDNFTFYYYAAAETLAQAMSKAGTDPIKVAEHLKSGTFATVVGTLRFTQTGDLQDPQYVVYEWKNGAYSQVKQ
jgi:branched-chain amino acid transport system substrate-binding protein